MIRVIQAIQKAKAAQVSFCETTAAERIQLLERLQEQIKLHASEIMAVEKAANGFDEEFLRAHLLEASIMRIKEASSELIANNESFSATGLISILLPSVLSFRVLCERLAPAIAAGNVVLVKLSSKAQDWSPLFLEMLKTAGFAEGVCQLIQGTGEEIGSLMASHPAIRAVSFAGRPSTAEKILRQPGSLYKKLQFSTSGNNSAILIGEEWPDDQLDLLIHSCIAGGGRLPWSTKKVFVAESASKKFVESFLSRLQMKKVDLSVQSSKFHQQVQDIGKEGGKSLLDLPAVFLDLPHCSPLQQDELVGPVVLISTVKYLHESIKWTNTGYLGMANLILGPEDKAQRAAQKLECGQVWINSWLRPEDGVIAGVKQSAVGDLDFRAFGSFYSDRKKIVGVQSK